MNWTEGKIHTFIVGVLRAGARRWPAKHEAMEEAFVGRKISKAGRMAKHYKCKHCGGEFTSKDVNCDHIDPVVDPTVGFVDWNTYIKRLFIEKEGYQILCSECHNKKSAEEKKIAKEYRHANQSSGGD